MLKIQTTNFSSKYTMYFSIISACEMKVWKETFVHRCKITFSSLYQIWFIRLLWSAPLTHWCLSLSLKCSMSAPLVWPHRTKLYSGQITRLDWLWKLDGANRGVLAEKLILPASKKQQQKKQEFKKTKLTTNLKWFWKRKPWSSFTIPCCV